MGKAESASPARDRAATPRKVRAGPGMRQKPNHTDKPKPSGQRGLTWFDVASALSSPKANDSSIWHSPSGEIRPQETFIALVRAAVRGKRAHTSLQ